MRKLGISRSLRAGCVVGSAFLSLSCCMSGKHTTESPPTTAPAATRPATQSAATTPPWPADKPVAPAVLPGAGLSQHDFFYAGEAKTEDMYIVRGGVIAWSFHDTKTKGEISDATLLSNGNVLFAHQHGVSLIDANHNVLWNYDAPAKSEIHTAQAIGKDHILFIINGPEPKVMVANIATGTIEHQFPLPVKNLNSTHGQFRRARLTDAGTLLVTHMDLGRVVEYDEGGKALWSIDAPGCWSAARLKNGDTLITANRRVYEVNPQGETIWQFTPGDIPDYKVTQFQIAVRLSNGNTLVNNWVNQWNATTQSSAKPQPAQAWEVSPDKQLVWALRAWTAPVNLGPATVIQLLDADSTPPEDVHFGDIR